MQAPQLAIKPPALRAGDLCVVVSPSWGGPACHPEVYEAGLRVLREELGLTVCESAHARHPAASVAQRVADLHEAFADPKARMVITSIGGEDSLLLLPHLRLTDLQRDPKVFMGFSDTTTLLTHMARHGLVSFHGPSVMAGLAQAHAFGAGYLSHLRHMLFEQDTPPPYAPYGHYCDGYQDWADPRCFDQVKPLVPDGGPRVLQGRGRARGRLFGGNLEIMEMLEGTPYWPMGDEWQGRILFFETSEEAPPPHLVRRALRSWGIAGIFSRLSALLVGRPRDYTDAAKAELDAIVVSVVRDEFGCGDLTVVSNLDFGHTDPQWVLPLGLEAEVCADRGTLALLEAPVTRRP